MMFSSPLKLSLAAALSLSVSSLPALAYDGDTAVSDDGVVSSHDMTGEESAPYDPSANGAGVSDTTGATIDPGPGFAEPAVDGADVFPSDTVSMPFAKGEATAPITVVKYASLTCPHCANFHNDTLPQLLEGPVADGRVRYVHKAFPLDDFATVMAAMPFCVDQEVGDGYHATLDTLYGGLTDLFQSEDPSGFLLNVASEQGLSQEVYMACLEDDDLMRAIFSEAQEGAERYEVRATPSFVINGTLYEGHLSMDVFNEIFDTLDPQ